MKYGYGNYYTEFLENVNPSDVEELSHCYDLTFFDKTKVQEILETLKQFDDKTKDGEGIHDTTKNYRNSQVYFLENNVMPYQQELIDKTMYLNNKYFDWDLNHLMKIQYTIYNQDNHFGWHPDGTLGYDVVEGVTVPPDMIHRKLTLVVMLSNKEDYEGGEFLLLDSQSVPEQSVCSFKMDAGEAILFPAFMYHKVMPVTKGQRKTLVAWFCGPRLR